MDKGRNLGSTKKFKLCSFLECLRHHEASKKVASACRLPPSGPTGCNAIRPAHGDIRLRSLARKYGNDMVIVILLLFLLSALDNSSTTDYSPRMSLSQIGLISGTRGVDLTNRSCLSSNSVHLINGAELDYRNGWEVTAVSYNGSMGPDGFRVSVVESSTVFRRRLHIPIQDYEWISASLQVKGLSGSANVSLSITPNISTVKYAGAEVNQWQTECLQVNSSLDELRIRYADFWMWEFDFAIRITAMEQAVVEFLGLDIEAHSSKILTPVSIDLQTTDQSSMLSNPQLRPALWYLLLVISRLDDGSRALVIAQVANETYYLPVGNYSVKAGWSPYAYWVNYIDSEQAEFVILENQTTLLGMRLPTIRLSIELSQYVVHVSVDMSGPGPAAFLSMSDLNLEQSVYLPASVGWINISVSHVTPWSHDGRSDHQFKLNGSFDLRMYIDYPYFVLLGVVMTYLDFEIIVLLASLVVALLIRFNQVFAPKRTATMLSDPGLIPFLLILLGAFLPWLGYVDRTSGLSSVVWPWLGVYAEQMPSGIVVPYQDMFWVLAVPLYVLFFWVPLLGAIGQMGTKEPILSQNRILSIGCPVVLTLVQVLPLIILEGWIPEVGMWMILFSPVVFVVQIGIQRVLLISRPTS